MKRILDMALLALVIVVIGAATPRKHTTPGQRARVAKARARASILGRNLIVNGGAETAEGGWGTEPGLPPPLESESYGHTAGEWGEGTSGAPEAGERYFRLPIPDSKESVSVPQQVSVAAESAAIDSGRVSIHLSGWFGGIIGDPGSMLMSAGFVGRDETPMGEIATAPPEPGSLPKPNVGSASLDLREASAPVPQGTRSIRVLLTARHLHFTDCENCSAIGLADNLSLTLTRAAPKN